MHAHDCGLTCVQLTKPFGRPVSAAFRSFRVVGDGAHTLLVGALAMVSTGAPWVMPEDIPALIAEGTNEFAINRPGSLACRCVQRSPLLEPQPTAGAAQPTAGAAAHGWSRSAHALG